MRRALACLISLFCLVSVLSVVSLVTATSAQSAISVDPRLGRADCALTGRVYVAGRGCARVRCVPGATIFKAGKNAELCQLRGRTGAEFASPISQRRCGALGRIWIGQVNSCAANPNRARSVIPGAPQCKGRTSTYVTHREEEGYYDECLTPRRVRELTRIAKREKESLAKAAQQRSRPNCGFRGGWVIDGDGVCVRRGGPPPAGDLGGFLMVGDSVSWRADNELAHRKGDWELDLRPGRRLDELQGRLDWYRADHGDPDRLIIQLGTNRRRGFNEQDFRTVMATVPDTVPVMFLLPFRAPNGDNAGPVAATKRYTQWMRNLAAVRPRTCLAEWATYASKNLDHLVDGEHPASRYEDWYARYVVRAWNNCEGQLGL